MKKLSLLLGLSIVVTLACGLSVNLTPDSPNPTVETTPVLIDPPTPTPEIFISLTRAIPATSLPPTDGVHVFYRPLSFTLPLGLASGISGSQVERADGSDVPAWELTPGHTVIKLEGYLLQGKFHQPGIYIYPATPYVELFPGAFESMHRLRNVMNSTAPVSADQLPAVPFFNAAQNYASNFQPVSFQNGSGVRFLTEYNQYPAPVNNHDLFYNFQGFSDDGEYYLVAIFPIVTPVLADTSDAGAPLPPAGIPFPNISDPNPDFQGYYTSVTILLNAASPDAFSPAIPKLDALIESMQITP